MTILRRQIFFMGIAIAFAAAVAWPEFGEAVRRSRIVNAGIFLNFLIVGASIEIPPAGSRRRRYARALMAATGSSLLIVPVVAWAAASWMLGGRSDLTVGTVIVASAPVTVASGTALTAMALGDVTLSLLICVATHLAGLFTMPLLLSVLLGAGQQIRLPVLSLLRDLALTILLPVALGWLGHRRLRPRLGAWSRALSQGVVLLIVFNAVSSSAPHMSWSVVWGRLAFFMILFHGVVLVYHYLVACWLRLDEAAASAFTIHSSQKTLTIPYIVWDGFFAVSNPLAMLPAIVYHLTQLVVDTAVAGFFRRRAERQAGGIKTARPADV